MNNGKARIVLVVVLCGLGLVGAVALADGGESSSGAAGAGIAQVSEIERAASDALSVLAAPRNQSDSMPSEVGQRIGEDHLYGVNPALSRLALGSISNALYVLPGRGYVCASLTVADGASLNCTETSELAAGRAGAATITLVDQNIGVYGLVPNGVETVAINTGSTSTTRADVEGNAYFGVLPKGTALRSVAYEGPSGSVEYPIYDPAAGVRNDE
jgi:hypothetical protein